jgi:sulfite exporter TauE/SafE
MDAARPAQHIDPRSAAVLSTAFGIGAGLLLGFAGLIFGGLIVILAFALVFRTADRVAIPWLLASFTSVWSVLFAVGTDAIVSLKADAPLLGFVTGFVPLGMCVGMVLLARARSRR